MSHLDFGGHLSPLFQDQLGSMSGNPTGGWKSYHQFGGFPITGWKSYYWLEILLLDWNPTGWKSYYWLEILIFKALAHWVDAYYKSKCQSVCPSVCRSVCSLLRYCLNVFLPPFPKVGCPIFLEIHNPWGKVIERSGLRFEHFCLEVV